MHNTTNTSHTTHTTHTHTTHHTPHTHHTPVTLLTPHYSHHPHYPLTPHTPHTLLTLHTPHYSHLHVGVPGSMLQYAEQPYTCRLSYRSQRVRGVVCQDSVQSPCQQLRIWRYGTGNRTLHHQTATYMYFLTCIYSCTGIFPPHMKCHMKRWVTALPTISGEWCSKGLLDQWTEGPRQRMRQPRQL